MNSDEECLVVGAIVVEKEEARRRKELINYSTPIPLIEKDWLDIKYKSAVTRREATVLLIYHTIFVE